MHVLLVRTALTLLVVGMVVSPRSERVVYPSVVLPALHESAASALRTSSVEWGDTPTAEGSQALRRQAAAVDDLTWIRADRDGPEPTPEPSARSALLREKWRALSDADAATVAHANAVLAGEAFGRASRVVARWLDRRDAATGLFPKSDLAEDQAWEYDDTGADLYGHLTLGTYFLAPRRYGELLHTLAAERRLAAGLPDDIGLPDGQRRGRSQAERIFGAAEYAKDGLLPLLERAGREPWLGRIRELADVILEQSEVPTADGPIPADSAEVNGDMLQILARLDHATGEPRYRAAADRIAWAYLNVLPTTRDLPPHRWDFLENEPRDRRRFRISDHGNEIFTGLIEWHLAESLRGEPDAPRHRHQLRQMLDRLLEKGRNEDGLWFRVVEIPSGKVEQSGLTDNWGYVLQAYWTAALIEELAPDGDPTRVERYRAAVYRALAALPKYSFYDWQRGEMDGYADAIEGALYLLHETRLQPAEAAAWVDEQMPVLYGFQGADGSVLDGYLDGNFIRTTLLYGFSQTQGVALRPWREGVLVGAAPDGDCLAVALSSQSDWQGRLVFDTPRHRLHLRAPVDYARLNKWPEWFVAEPERTYEVTDLHSGITSLHPGQQLAAGLPLVLRDDVSKDLRVCPR